MLYYIKAKCNILNVQHTCLYAVCISKLHDVKLLLGDVLHYLTGGLSLSMFGYNALTSQNITISCIPVHGICHYVRFAQSSVFIRLPNHPPSTKHIVVLDTYCHGAPGSREIPTQSLAVSILSCKPLQLHSVSFAAICGLCEKDKVCSFWVVWQSKCEFMLHHIRHIHFLCCFYILFQIATTVICIYIPHTSYLCILCICIFWVWPRVAVAESRFTGIPYQNM